MILDSLDNSATYQALGPRFVEAFDYLKKFDPSTPDGRYEIEGSQFFALVQTYEPEAPEKRTFESHRNHVDVQYILSGREVILYAASASLTPKAPYDQEKDATYYEDRESRPVYLSANEFVILWPQDGHKPACLWDSPAMVRKVVLKLRFPTS